MALIVPPLTLTRASAATLLRSTDGALVEFGNNAPRFDPSLGLLIEGQRTNTIRNPGLQGVVAGTPGTPGTHWDVFVRTSTGVTTQVLGVVTIGGIRWLEVALAGTPVGNGSLEIFPETATGIPAVTGQTWTFSWLQQGLGVSGIGQTSVVYAENTSGGAFVAAPLGVRPVASLSGVPVRCAVPGLLSGGGTIGAVRPYLFWPLTNGVPVAGVIRIAFPQFEQAPSASSPILPPAGAPVVTTRFLENGSASLASLGIAPSGACTIVGTFMLPQNAVTGIGAQNLLQIDNGTGNNRYLLRNDVGSGNINIYRVTGGAGTGSALAGGMTPGTPFKTALSIDGNGRISTSMNSGSVVAHTGGPVSGLTTLRVGMNEGFSENLNGYVRGLAYLPYAVSDAMLQQFSAL